jgi:hypothetical protein
MVLLGNKGFNLKANPQSKTLFDKPLFTGKHTWDTAFFIALGPVNLSVISDLPQVTNIAGIISHQTHNP